MSADSPFRRLLKKALYPVLNQRSYQMFQCVAKAWDIKTGAWSEPELDLIPPGVSAGDTVLDIGANYGLYSYHLSRAVGSAGRVVAFEPVPFTGDTFRWVGKLLGFRNVELVCKGCSDTDGRILFTLPIQNAGPMSAGLAHSAGRNNERQGKSTHFPYQKTEQIWCEVVALDHFLPMMKNLSFIKCDIEGAELLAFRGAQKIIAQHRPTILCEINPWFLEGFGFTLKQLLDFFFDLDYRLYRYEKASGRGFLKAMTADDVVEDNYLFLHPSREKPFQSLRIFEQTS